MMNKRTLRLLLISCITTFIFSSCINNDYDLGNLSDNIILQGESAVMPIGEFNTTIEDILKKDKSCLCFSSSCPKSWEK